MAARRRKKGRTPKPKGTARRPPSVAASLPEPTPQEIEQEKRTFERGIVSRAEAVPRGAPLPPGATHEVTKEGGRPALKRKRFSAR